MVKGIQLIVNKIIHHIYIVLDNSKVSLFKKIGYKFGEIFIGESLYSVYKYRDVKFELNPLNYIDRRLIEGRDFESEVIAVMDEFLANGGYFIDIGVNFGFYSILNARIKDVFVIGFEPSTKELFRIYRNIELNNFRNISVYPVALTEKNHSLKLFIAPYRNSGLNSIKTSYDLGHITVQGVRVENLLNDEIIDNLKVIKIDVEGAELEVLKGFGTSLSKLNDMVVIVEITPRDIDIDSLYDLMRRQGFKERIGLNKDSIQYYEFFVK